ncbi:YfiR family protein [Fontimonas sp. SYSU GA230001]|uniref:YfiR family protein n=1 Tax=Fontimonas sp. SYSU GA230001 TaxID=3142450 RepID=UPI0032B488C6
MNPRTLLRNGLLVLLLAGAAMPLRAAELPEYKLKAAFVFNFVRFTSWPPERLPDDGSTIEICAAAETEFVNALREAVTGKSIGTHPLRVREVAPGDDTGSCHVVYVGNRSDAGRILAATAGRGILTVHNGDSASRDGVVRFFIDDRRIRFEINAGAATRESLQLSSKLLSLANVVSL